MTVARLQLAVGTAASLVEEVAQDESRRVFTARAPHETEGVRVSRLVVLHPLPPHGPTPGALLDRMASIRAIGHPALAAPLATGTADGAAWVVEPAPGTATLHERLGSGTLLTVHDAVRLLREGARALAALHRRGLHHGAIDARLLTFDTGGLRIYGLGRGTGGSASADLHRLGMVVQRTMQGDLAYGVVRTRVMPPPLEELLASLTSEDPGARPASADAVLTALDWFPSAGQGTHRTLLDSAGRGGRPPGHRRAALLLAVAAVVLLLTWLLVRPR